MERQESSAGAVVEKLGAGWSPTHCGLAEEFLHHWGRLFDTTVEERLVGDGALHFVTSLEAVCLRGMDEASCLMLGGDADAPAEVRSLLSRAAGLSLVLTFSQRAYDRAKTCVPAGRCLLLPPGEVQGLMLAADPYARLKQRLWEQINRLRLIPFNFLAPARGGMFFGRRSELERLREEDNTSFAISGPGRIGKTSLLARYRQLANADRMSARAPHAPISFYECSDRSADGVARYFAMRIDPSKQSERMTADGLVNFLRYQQTKLGAPLNLLLDEVDEVCQSDAFKYLGDAAVKNLCRLVMCGKGVLLKMMLSPKSPLECRLDLIRPGPLEERAARELLLLPLADLGFEVGDPETLAEYVLRLTGRLPHLIHIYGKKLAELAHGEGAERITLDHAESVKWDHLVAQYFIEPLLKIKSGAARVDLTINNVLTWHRSTFSIANEGLRFYAREMKFLDRALAETRAELNSPA